MKHLRTLLMLSVLACANILSGFAQVTVDGELKKWHKLTLEVEGPSVSETGSVNPFLYYKLTGVFTNGNLSYEVPGYFAADGDAAETGASSGDVWRIHFTPPATGDWGYTIRFRQGTEVSIEDAIDAGTAVSGLDNLTGSFSIGVTDKTAPDLRAKGRLEYVGLHHLQFAETGEYFIKAGSDSPENLLAYEDFDNTPDNGSYRKSWSAHADDWETGDPSWLSGKGTEIIGAINYLASKGLNTYAFLSMNIEGDDENVYPYVTDTDYTQFDCSKLDQWGILFDHAQEKGLHAHFKLQEQENDQLLDGGDLDTDRKVYYRELIARFGHLLAVSWNLGEENTQTDQQRIDMAQYFKDNDPYNNNVDIHSYPSQKSTVYTPLLGDASELTGASLQSTWSSVHADTKTWVTASADAGKKWVVANDEQGSAGIGVPTDDYTGSPDKDDIRHQTLWGNFMAGGAGVEYYFGYSLDNSDLSCQDFRDRDISWDYCKIALDFFTDYLPFWEMSNADDLTDDSDDYVLAKTGIDATYAIYLPTGGSVDIDLSASSGTLEVKWYDPRNGGSLQNGSVTSVTGGSTVSTGTAPNSTSSDWVVLVRSTGTTSDNLALGGTATQSSTDYTGEASRAIDGNTSGSWSDGSVTHTESESGAWWQVDLGAENIIGEIVIYNRTDDCCIDRLTNFTVTIINSTGTTTFSESYTSYPNPSISIDAKDMYGQIVKIQLDDTNPLSLAEVEIYAGEGLRIEAEDYTSMSGIQTDETTDADGGDFVGWIQVGDYMVYSVDIPQAGIYYIDYRVASLTAGIGFVISSDGTTLETFSSEATGDWQAWKTDRSSSAFSFTEGTHTIKITSTVAGWNINWMEFVLEDESTSTCDVSWSDSDFSVSYETVNYSSGAIDISCATSVSISMDLFGDGPMEAADYCNVYYAVDGGSQVAISENTNAFDSKTVSVSGVSGSSLEIIAEVYTSYSDETFYISDINVLSQVTKAVIASPLSSPELEDRILSYPNPVKDELRVEILEEGLNIEELSISLYTVQGQKVVDFEHEKSNAIQLNLSGLDAGTYLITIGDNSNQLVRKIIKL